MLSSDEFQGRVPGSPGEEKTVSYITAQFQKLGLKPGNTDGTYIQKVPLVGITGAEAKPLAITGQRTRDAQVEGRGGGVDEARRRRRQHRGLRHGLRRLRRRRAGVQLGRLQGRRRQGQDDRRPRERSAVPDASDPSKLDPKMFNGKAMTYYGRWTYKFEEAARRGAAGVLIVHEKGPAGYPYAVVQGILGEKFDLVTPDKNMGRASVEGWLSLDAAKEAAQDGRPGLRRAEEAGDDARLQAGAARAQGVDGAQQHDAHDRFPQRARKARGQRPGAQERVRRLHRRTGITSASAIRTDKRRQDLQRRARQRVRRRVAARDRARLHPGEAGARSGRSCS